MTRRPPLLACLLLLIATTSRADTANVGVRDGGRFFSNAAEQKATDALLKLHDKHHGKEVMIETLDALPDGQGAREFAATRAAATKLNGLYVLVVRKGGVVGVLPDTNTRKVFTDTVSAELRSQFAAGLKKGPPSFDAALLEAVASIEATFDRADRPGVAATTTQPTTTVATRAARSRTEQIFDALTGDIPEIRKAAADVLRTSVTDRTVAAEAAPRLVAMLSGGGDPATRREAADLLGDVAKAQPELVTPAIPALVAALRDNASNELRRAAARALGRAGAGSEAVRAALTTAAENDADAAVRDEAAAALMSIKSPKP